MGESWSSYSSCILNLRGHKNWDWRHSLRWTLALMWKFASPWLPDLIWRRKELRLGSSSTGMMRSSRDWGLVFHLSPSSLIFCQCHGTLWKLLGQAPFHKPQGVLAKRPIDLVSRTAGAISGALGLPGPPSSPQCWRHSRDFESASTSGYQDGYDMTDNELSPKDFFNLNRGIYYAP